MRTADAFRSAFENLVDHKLRSALTMLGMMFGVAAVIAMLSIGAGAEKQAMDLIDKLGVRNVVVRAKDFRKEELEEIRQKSLGLSERDVVAIKEAIPNIDVVAPRVKISPYIVLGAGTKTKATVYGVSANHTQVSSIRMAKGRFIDSYDEANHAQACVIGAKVKRDLFGVKPALGQTLKINDSWCEVIGLLAKDRSTDQSVEGVSLGSDDESIYIPYTTAIRKFDHEALASPLDEIVMRLGDNAPASDTSIIVRTLLDRLHSGADDFELIVPEALLKQSQQTQNLFNIVMGCIAGISLVVGGIGIMNIMLASVLEQTREIGVRRAVGARRKDIRFQFLVSAFCLSMLGGLIGIALGVLISRIVAASAGWPTVVTWASILLSTGVSVSVGLISGFYPAIRASNLEPIQALHHD